MTVVAHDSDTGKNGDITYRMKNGFSRFVIECKNSNANMLISTQLGLFALTFFYQSIAIYRNFLYRYKSKQLLCMASWTSNE